MSGVEDKTDLLKEALAEYYCNNKNYEKGLTLFKEIIKDSIDNDIVKKYVVNSLQYAQGLMKDKKWVEVLEVYKDIIKFPVAPLSSFKNIGLCLSAIGSYKYAIEFFKLFEELSEDKYEVCIFIGEIAAQNLDDKLLAIEYYEKALHFNKENPVIYSMLGHLYSTVYRDKYKEKQIDYLTKAFELAPDNRIIVKNLAYVLGKFNEIKKADEMYGRLMMLNPTHSDLHSYGAYLVKHKRFKEGFRFLRHRFLKEDLKNVSFPSVFTSEKAWKVGQDITDKKVLVHFEQGFGDSIMFIRFVKQLKNVCREVDVVVQKGLIDLFKDSKLGVNLFTPKEIKSYDGYDCVIPMMDLPLICNINVDNIPFTKGYLSVPKAKVTKYKKEHINNNKKFKIGIAYEGSKVSAETKRDIPLSYFYSLMQMKDVEVYCFQVDDINKQMDNVLDNCKFVKLGSTFKNWEDTACAMKCMDIMITTDNGVMNLAGALGVKTFGLFNSITEWRWIKTEGNDVAWYSSVKPFQCSTSDGWGEPVSSAMKEVLELIFKKDIK